jgi:predicted PhzF superfamily epimerase YddE/YHI9
MSRVFYQVDAFTARPFAGNPAAVFVLGEPQEERWMQLVAREMNLSETAFLERREDGYALRWFTPALEVDLCGHATLASAHVLWEAGYEPAGSELRFHTRGGLLGAVRQGEWIELDFPSDPPAAAEPPAGLLAALGTTAKWTGRTQRNWFVELESEDALRALRPDFRRLAESLAGDLGVIASSRVLVTSGAESEAYDFVSRYFAPGAGIDEDPVTGSAHCSLAPFWAGRLGRDELVGFQASARGGEVRVRSAGERVKLGGQAVTVVRGELL